jgi:hypothetical protein
MNIHMDSKLKNLKNVSRPSSSASESKNTTVVVSSSKGNVSKTAVPVAKAIGKTVAPAAVVVASVPVKAVRGGAKTVPVAAVAAVAAPTVVAKAVKGGAKAVEPVSAVKSKEVTKAVATKAVPVKAAPAKTAPAKVEAAKTVPAKATKAAKVVASKVEVTKKGGAVKTTVAKTEKVAATPVQQRKKVAAQVVKEEVTKAKKTVEKVQESADDIEEQTNGKLRYFKLFFNDEICGRYCGKKPKQAANKAFSSIIKDLKKSGNETAVEIAFSIKECTRNSKHKEYKYIGQRQVLKEPVKVEIQNNDGTIKEIVYKYHNLLSKAPK